MSTFRSPSQIAAGLLTKMTAAPIARPMSKPKTGRRLADPITARVDLAIRSTGPCEVIGSESILGRDVSVLEWIAS